MEKFRVSDALRGVVEPYPDATLIKEVAIEGGESARVAISRLWLSEGIPYAFKECPGIYEAVRTWLGGRLNVDPKEINVTGSARLGQSLSPKQIGKPFMADSDLDIFIVSQLLFNNMKHDFNAWSYDFESGKIKPSNSRERGFWEDNNQRGPKLISRGFLDSKLVPNHKSYATIKNVAQTMWLLKEKLAVTLGAPMVAKASVRCYRSWNEYVRQMVLSLV